MAVVTRRFRRQGTVNTTLTQRVSATAAVNANFSNVLDVDVDNATADATASLDQFMASIGFTFDAAAIAVDVSAHGSRHTSSGADSAPLATTSVAGIMSAADKTKLDGIATNAIPQILNFGYQSIGSAAETRFGTFGGWEMTTAPLVEIGVTMAHGGTARNLFVRHNSAVGTNNVVYTVRKNGVNQTLTVTVPNGSINQVSDLTHTFAFVAGDRLSVNMLKALGITNGVINVSGSIEVIA